MSNMKNLNKKISGLLNKLEDMQHRYEVCSGEANYLENIVKSLANDLDLIAKELKKLSSYHYSVEWYEMIQDLDDEANKLERIRDEHKHKYHGLKLELIWTENMIDEMCKWVAPSKA